MAQLAAEDMVTPALEKELLANAEVYNVVLRRNEVRQLVLSSSLPTPISNTFDLREAGPWALIRDAFICLFDPDDQIIRVIGYPVQSAGLLIEITMDSAPMRNAMLDYGGRILLLSALISGVTAFFLFLAVINEVVWRTQSTDFWVNFKLFGVVPLTFIFGALQYPLLMKHGIEKKPDETPPA